MTADMMELSKLDANAKGQLACSLAVLLLHDEKIDISAEKVAAVLKSAKVEVAAYWPMLLAKNLEGKSVASFMSVGAAPAAAAAPQAAAEKKPAAKVEKVEEPVEEDMDVDMGGLFD